MADLTTIDESKKVPVSMLIELLNDFIQRLNKSIKYRWALITITCIVGTIVLIWTLCQDKLKDLGSPGAAMIAMAAGFYITAGLALLLGVIDRRDKRSYTESILTSIELHNEDIQKNFEVFLSKFYNVLDTLFK